MNSPYREPYAIIARFSKSIAIPFAAFEIALGISLPITIFHPPSWSPYYHSSFGITDFVALLCSLLITFGGMMIVYEIIFKSCRAIWIEGDEIVYVDTYWNLGAIKVRRADIRSFALGTIGPYKQRTIEIQLQSGERKSVRTFYLSEPRDVIFSRLNQIKSGETLKGPNDPPKVLSADLVGRRGQ